SSRCSTSTATRRSSAAASSSSCARDGTCSPCVSRRTPPRTPSWRASKTSCWTSSCPESWRQRDRAVPGDGTLRRLRAGLRSCAPRDCYRDVMSVLEGHLSATGLRVGLVVGRFNELVTRRLLDGALDALRRMGVDDDDVTVAWVPGAVEIPLVAKRMAEGGHVDAVVTLGAVVRG